MGLSQSKHFVGESAIITPHLLPVVVSIATDNFGTVYPVNERQKGLLHYCKSYNPKFNSLYDTCITSDTDVLKAFLTPHGVMVPTLGGNDVAVAATFKLEENWENTGSKCDIRAVNGKMYKGMSLPSVPIYNYTMGNKKGRLAQVELGDNYLVTFLSYRWDNIVSLVEVISSIRVSENDNYVGLQCPTVDILLKDDISWLIGMRFGPKRVGFTSQSSSLVINELGLGAKAATVVVMNETCSRTRDRRRSGPLVINGSFLVYITPKRGHSSPIFISYITEQSFTPI
jgi:hypothetical protein